MYYIDEIVKIDKSFTEKIDCGYHIIARLTIDYVNKNTTIELASWQDKQSFLDRGESLVSFLTINDSPRFSVDPSLFALRSFNACRGVAFLS